MNLNIKIYCMLLQMVNLSCSLLYLSPPLTSVNSPGLPPFPPNSPMSLPWGGIVGWERTGCYGNKSPPFPMGLLSNWSLGTSVLRVPRVPDLCVHVYVECVANVCCSPMHDLVICCMCEHACVLLLTRLLYISGGDFKRS